MEPWYESRYTGLFSRCGPIGRPPCEISTGRPLSFAVERRDGAGRLRSRTWVVLSDELPLQEVPLTAAVARDTFAGEDADGWRP